MYLQGLSTPTRKETTKKEGRLENRVGRQSMRKTYYRMKRKGRLLWGNGKNGWSSRKEKPVFHRGGREGKVQLLGYSHLLGRVSYIAGCLTSKGGLVIAKRQGPIIGKAYCGCARNRTAKASATPPFSTNENWGISGRTSGMDEMNRTQNPKLKKKERDLRDV